MAQAHAVNSQDRPDLWLLGLCSARFFTTLIFMTYAASLPVLRVAWDMSGTQAGSVSTGFQVGYAVSLLAFSWLADRVGARRVYLSSAVASAATALAFASLARSYASGLVLLTLAAVAQGGTYTTAIMLIADRFPPKTRGSAMGWLIASSSLSHAASLLLTGAMLPRGGYPLAFMAAATGPVLGLVVAWLALRSTPNVVHPRHATLRVQTEVFRNPQAVRLTAGYVFHSWELLGMWAWAPAFVAASLARAGAAAVRSAEVGAYLASAFHVMGLLASSSMGHLSDRLGRRTVLLALAAASAGCSLVFGWLVAAPLAVLALVGALYGFAALGDSPVLSVALTEAVRPAYLGAALAVRSILGFGAGAAAPLVFGAILDATNPPGVVATTWGWAFGALGVGGLVAACCAYGLPRDRVPATRGPSGGRMVGR
ncbi:MAG: MFS transporter [Armatimonadota bacterium]|nr:MFS transporter [Armatimonadota bacterium]